MQIFMLQIYSMIYSSTDGVTYHKNAIKPRLLFCGVYMGKPFISFAQQSCSAKMVNKYYKIVYLNQYEYYLHKN